MQFRLDVTKRCNAKCIFCEIPDSIRDESLSFEEIKKKIAAASKECDSILFTGGEAAIREDILDVISYAKEKGFTNIKIETNGLILAYYDFVKKMKDAGLSYVQISFQTIDSDEYDYITKVSGALELVKKGIVNLNELKIPFSTNTVLYSKNAGLIFETVSYLLESGSDHIILSSLNPCGDDEIAVKYSSAVKEISELFKNLSDKDKSKVSLSGFPQCIIKKEDNSLLIYAESVKLPKDVSEAYKMKLLVCKYCPYLDFCGGPWRFYVSRFGDSEFS